MAGIDHTQIADTQFPEHLQAVSQDTQSEKMRNKGKFPHRINKNSRH